MVHLQAGSGAERSAKPAAAGGGVSALIEPFAYPLTALFDQIRRLINWSPSIYALMNAGPAQPMLAFLGRIKGRGVYEKARRHAPAYRAFLAANPTRVRRFEDVPTTDKVNYVKPHSVEQRCYGGRIPPFGSVIDESSGSSGTPNNWVRGPEERARAARDIQLNYGLMFGHAEYFLINCFALGPWATGMNVSMSLSNVGILKPIGPDKAKLENTLKLFGKAYRYLIFGYPPFIKQFVDTTELTLGDYELHAIVGGEGLSEALRTHLLASFKTVLSSYGASDLEINLGTETELTIAVRRACLADRTLSTRLFGRDTPPMIFQYNPIDHYVEVTEDGELLFTITRLGTAAPKVRYNLHDMGGVITYRELERVLAECGAPVVASVDRISRFPLLYVFGRSDMTVPFYGAKVSPADLEAVVSERCEESINSFQFGRDDGDDGEAELLIRLECRSGVPVPVDTSDLHARIFEGLKAVNQDFREVTRMFRPDRVRIEVYAFETGPFAERDIRVKSKYML